MFNLYTHFVYKQNKVIPRYLLALPKVRGRQLKLNLLEGDVSKTKKTKLIQILGKTLAVFIIISITVSAHFTIAYDGNAAKLSTWITAEQYKAVGEYTQYDFVNKNQDAFSAFPVLPKEEEIISEKMWVAITAYSSTPDQTFGDPFITASGERVRDGIVAANFLPMGTQIKIPSVYGEKIFVVKDRMNARYWHRVDIWMPTRQEALQFGIQTLQIEIIK